MKTYTIKKGQSDFNPTDNGFSPIVLKKMKHIKINFKLDNSCWYNWGTDADVKDWNKITGVSSYFQRNNQNSIMVVWRPAAEAGKFEVSIFTNWLNSYWTGFYWETPKREVMLTVEAGQEVEVILELSDETLRNTNKKLPDWKATMTNKVTGETATVQHIKADYSWGRKTGAFFGGANNSPGEFGGVASQDMFLEYSFEIIK